MVDSNKSLQLKPAHGMVSSIKRMRLKWMIWCGMLYVLDSLISIFVGRRRPSSDSFSGPAIVFQSIAWIHFDCLLCRCWSLVVMLSMRLALSMTYSYFHNLEIEFDLIWILIGWHIHFSMTLPNHYYRVSRQTNYILIELCELLTRWNRCSYGRCCRSIGIGNFHFTFGLRVWVQPIHGLLARHFVHINFAYVAYSRYGCYRSIWSIVHFHCCILIIAIKYTNWCGKWNSTIWAINRNRRISFNLCIVIHSHICWNLCALC